LALPFHCGGIHAARHIVSSIKRGAGIMQRQSAQFYDLLYEGMKDYQAEAEQIHERIQRHSESTGGGSLLDVACGTGQHLARLQSHYRVEGLDADPGMLAIAARRLPGVPLHQADMRDFDLGRRFDVVTCLFSAIGYRTTIRDLRRAIRSMALHLRPGGLLIVEPWFTPDQWRPGRAAAIYVDLPELKIARMNVSQTRGRLSILDFHYLVARPSGIERFRERFNLGLFTVSEYRSAFEAGGLSVELDPVGLMGRGLYVASS
jgi:SAM-dependent methyltransferase